MRVRSGLMGLNIAVSRVYGVILDRFFFFDGQTTLDFVVVARFAFRTPSRSSSLLGASMYIATPPLSRAAESVMKSTQVRQFDS